MNPSQVSPFGSYGSGVVASGGSDIVLNSTPNKSRKGLIIAVVVGVILVIGLVVAIVMNRGGANVSSSTRDDFNLYANYLLYGEESNAELKGEYDESMVYAIDDLRLDGTNNSKIVAFFGKTEELWANFLNNVGVVETRIADAIDAYTEKYELTRMIYVWPGLDEQSVMNKLLTSEASDVKNWIRTSYSDYTDSGYELVRKYGDASIRYYDLYVDYLGELRTAGCISETGEFNECEAEDSENWDDKLEEAELEMTDTSLEAEIDTVRDVWTISDMLYGRASEEAEGAE